MKKELSEITIGLIEATLENLKENGLQVEAAALTQAIKLIKLLGKEVAA